MAAQAGSARTDGEPEPTEHAPSSFEYRSRLKVLGLPLVHVVRGIDPSSGRRPTAVGIIAIGQVAVGVVAIGQVAVGGISIGQASIGLGWGIGQLAFGMLAAGQVAAGLLGAAGQLAVAPYAVGMVTDTGLFVAAGWLMTGILLAAAAARRRRRLGSAARHAVADAHRVRSRRAGARRRRGRVRRSAARAPVQPPVRVLAYGPRRPGDARARTQRRQRHHRGRVGAGVRRLRQRGHLHPQRQLPRDRRARLGAAPRDVAGARRVAARRGTGHA